MQVWKAVLGAVAGLGGLGLTAFIAFSWAVQPLSNRLDRIDSDIVTLTRVVAAMEVKVDLLMRRTLPSLAAADRRRAAGGTTGRSGKTTEPRANFFDSDGCPR